MTDAMLETLHKLSSAALLEVAKLCRQSQPELPTTHALQQVAGADLGGELSASLGLLRDLGWRGPQVALLAEGIAQTRERSSSLEKGFDLVVSGPEVPGVPTRDTVAVFQAMIAEAENEVWLVGYAVHNGKRLFRPLAERLDARPSLKLRFCLDIARKPTDTSLSSEIVRRFALDFAARHWPWEPRPEVFYDPRSLEELGPKRSSLHAKCVVVDRKVALVTSANFTEAAQLRNLEVGVAVRHKPTAERLVGYFEGLIATKQLLRCELPD